MSENTAVFGKNNRNRQKQLETITLTNNGNVVFQVTFINSICLKSYRKTRSRRDYGPADFGSLQTEASVKLTPLAAFLIFRKKTMWPF